jgi:hypothetical protein
MEHFMPGTASDRQLVESAGAYKFADAKFCACVYDGAAVDRTAWSAWKPEGFDLIPAPVAPR